MRDFLTVAPQSVDASSKDREDGEKVSRELFLGAEVSLIENHELPAVALEQRLDEFCSKPRKTVSVGDHNTKLISLVYSLQYGKKSFALEVESRTDLADDLGVRISFSHEGDLPLEVG